MCKLTVAVLLLLVVNLLYVKYCMAQYYQSTSTSRNYNNQGYQQFQQSHSHPNFQHHHHHHHNHDHNFNYPYHDHQFPNVHNHGNFGDPPRIHPNAIDNTSVVPMDVFQQMDSYTEMSELLERFVEGYKEEQPSVGVRFETGDNAKPVVVKAKCPKCEPELHTVEIVTEDEEDPNVVYIPKCVRIERCGGCCASRMQSCQPVSSEKVYFEVQKLEYFDKGKFKKAQAITKVAEKHTKCKCDCKIKEKDCNRYQIFNRSACRCMCSNFEEEYRCYEENATKIWEPYTCSCQCRTINQCSTGFIFDLISCKCVPVPFGG